MTITLYLEFDDAVEVCAILARHACRSAVDLAAQMQDAIQDEGSRLYDQHQQDLMESGGYDDSAYRQQLKDAGRGHLLR